MNMKYFSASENAFYAGELKESYIAADSWPSDALEVDESLYLEFIDEPPAGKYRGVDDAGMPCWRNSSTHRRGNGIECREYETAAH